MDLTPEVIEAVGKTAVSVIAAIGAVVATVASAISAFYTAKNRRETEKNSRDLHIAHDRIREIKGEPLQHRQAKKK